ncbi:MAG: hypothetical protein V2A53_09885 [bacterium]
MNFCLKQHGVKEDFPDFAEERIQPFSENEVLQFIDEILLPEDIRLGLNLKKKILTLVGRPVPYFIQPILSEVLNCKSLTEQELEKIYSEKIL